MRAQLRALSKKISKTSDKTFPVVIKANKLFQQPVNNEPLIILPIASRQESKFSFVPGAQSDFYTNQKGGNIYVCHYVGFMGVVRIRKGGGLRGQSPLLNVENVKIRICVYRYRGDVLTVLVTLLRIIFDASVKSLNATMRQSDPMNYKLI